MKTIQVVFSSILLCLSTAMFFNSVARADQFELWMIPMFGIVCVTGVLLHLAIKEKREKK